MIWTKTSFIHSYDSHKLYLACTIQIGLTLNLTSCLTTSLLNLYRLFIFLFSNNKPAILHLYKLQFYLHLINIPFLHTFTISDSHTQSGHTHHPKWFYILLSLTCSLLITVLLSLWILIQYNALTIVLLSVACKTQPPTANCLWLTW